MITVRDYSIWVSGTESRWADPDPVRILKWLTVSFRKECPTGDEALWGCTVQVQTGLLCKNASIVRSRSWHLTELSWTIQVGPVLPTPCMIKRKSLWHGSSSLMGMCYTCSYMLHLCFWLIGLIIYPNSLHLLWVQQNRRLPFSVVEILGAYSYYVHSQMCQSWLSPTLKKNADCHGA